MMNWKLLAGTVCAMAVTAVFADGNAAGGGDWMAYKANEFNVSAFGTGTVGERTLDRPSARRIERNGNLGLGAGVSYFFTRHIGVEGFGFTESTSDHLVDQLNGDLIVRLPLGPTGLAIYGLGGGGRQFDPETQWTLDLGGGVEWRFTDRLGVFADARYVWADETRDYGLGRVGLRIGF
jgi:hypothetical protein